PFERRPGRNGDLGQGYGCVGLVTFLDGVRQCVAATDSSGPQNRDNGCLWYNRLKRPPNLGGKDGNRIPPFGDVWRDFRVPDLALPVGLILRSKVEDDLMRVLDAPEI